ncbi:MAG: hypothetical protein ACK5Y2_04210 [Bdellovibrionales bacterium]
MKSKMILALMGFTLAAKASPAFLTETQQALKNSGLRVVELEKARGLNEKADTSLLWLADRMDQFQESAVLVFKETGLRQDTVFVRPEASPFSLQRASALSKNKEFRKNSDLGRSYFLSYRYFRFDFKRVFEDPSLLDERLWRDQIERRLVDLSSEAVMMGDLYIRSQVTVTRNLLKRSKVDQTVQRQQESFIEYNLNHLKVVAGDVLFTVMELKSHYPLLDLEPEELAQRTKNLQTVLENVRKIQKIREDLIGAREKK